MSAQIKLLCALVLIALSAGGIWWYSSRPGEQRTARPAANRPIPAAGAARQRTPVKEAQRLDVAKTVDELEKERAEEQRAEVEQPPGPAGRDGREPTLGTVDEPYEPRQALPILPRPAEPGHVAGTIVDENGDPIQARTMMVGESGSQGGGKSAEDGGFDLERGGRETFWVKAWTEDGRVGVFSHSDLDASEGVSDATIQLDQGAKLELTLTGDRDSCRIGLITDGMRHSDFTLRSSGPASQVVPSGYLTVEAYDGSGDDKVVYDTRSLFIEAGQDESVEFQLYR